MFEKLAVIRREDLFQENKHLLSPVIEPGESYDSWVPSWSLFYLPDSPVVISMRFGSEKGWTGWMKKYSISYQGCASITGNQQKEAFEEGNLLSLRPASICQMRVNATDSIRSLGLSYYNENEVFPCDTTKSEAWGTELLVRPLSQLIEGADACAYSEQYEGNVARHICFPTCLGMVLNWFGVTESVPSIAEKVLDTASGRYGNWALNTAYASLALKGESYVVSLNSLSELEREIHERESPVVVRISWEEGELRNASQLRSEGHLITIVGFTVEGDVIVNDPNSDSLEKVRRVFTRQEFYNVWQKRNKIAYIFRPYSQI